MWAIFESLPYRSAQIFQICFMVLLQYVLSDFARFVDTRIVILCQLELDILVKLQLRISILGISGR